MRKFRQRVTSKHTVNANELGTCALPGWCGFRMSLIAVDRKEPGLLVANKIIHSQTNIDTKLFISYIICSGT